MTIIDIKQINHTINANCSSGIVIRQPRQICDITKPLVVIDPSVPNYQQLVQGVAISAHVHVLDADADGVAQITQLLEQLTDIQTLHVVSHGSAGYIYLGNIKLSLDTLDHYSWELQSWFSHSGYPTSNTLLIYGCSVAASLAGTQLISQLHQLTGASIAAATGPIGQELLGGTWDLDYVIGQNQVESPFTEDTRQSYEGLLTNAPVITDNSTVDRTTNEDTALSITGLVVEDIDGEPQTITLSVTQGTLTLDSINGLSNVIGNGTNTLSFSGSLSSINGALNSLTYLPTADYSGDEVLAITVNDGDQTTSRNVAIAITPVNDAPIITPSAPSVLEGGAVAFATSNFGIFDVDNLDVQIIVKLHSLPDKGYLTLGGSRLVVGSTFSYDQVSQLQYHHDGTQTTAPGGTSDGFTVTVDDGAGGTIAPTLIPITIAPVNQLPSVGGTNTLFEGEVDHPVAIAISDPDQTSTYGIEIISLPVDGILNLNGVAISVGQSLSSADLANLTYTHDGNDQNNGFPPADSFQIKVTDDGGGTGIPGSTTATISLNIKPNNDDPVLVANTGLELNTTANGLIRVITAAELGVVDPDSPTTQLTYTLTTIPSSTVGTLQVFRSSTWQKLGVGTSFTQDDINDGRLRYVFHKDSSGNETFTDSFSFEVRDGDVREYPTLREGGIWTPDGSALVINTFNITVTVPPGGSGGAGGTQTPDIISNEPPTIDLNVGIAGLFEGEFATITNALLKTTDTDNIPGEIVYRIETLPTSGVIKLNGVTLGLYGSFTQADIDNNRVTFHHAGDEDFIDSFQFTVSDGKNVTFRQTFTIDVTPQNDAPTISVGGILSLAEGESITITNVSFALADVDGTGEKSGMGFATPNTLTFQVVALPTYGILQIDQGGGFVEVTTSTIITKAQLDSGKLRYVHDGTENFSDSFSVQANDNTGTANQLSTIETVNISIAKLNDAPASLSSAPLTVSEGGSGLIKGFNKADGDAHLIYDDPDNTTVQRQYRITTNVAHGTLFLNGKALAVGSVFTQDDLDKNRITYVHKGIDGHTTDRFFFEVRDGGGDVVLGDYTINVTPVNDAPTLMVPGTQNFGALPPLIFSLANGNQIVVNDIDLQTLEPGETDVLQVTIDLQALGATYVGSTITLGSTIGLTFVEGANGTASKLTFQGTLANVQAALDGLQIQVPEDEDRSLSMVVTVNDLNNGGPDPSPLPSGYSTIVTKTITINASNVNDAPVVNRPASVIVNEDTGLNFTGGKTISVSDVDTFDSTNNTVTLNVTNGRLTLANTSLITGGANNSNTITLTGSLSTINAALAGLSYRGNLNFNGSDTLTITADDNGNIGTGGSQITISTVPIAVTPVNDAPSLVAPTATQSIASNSPLVFSTATGNAIVVDDLADLNNGSADTFTVTLNVANGSLTAASSGAVVTGDGTNSVTISGTKADVNAALNGLSYTPADFNSEATVNLQIILSDNANGGTAVGGVGDALTATRTVTINISGTNDPPVITAPLTRVATEDMQITFSGANLISIDDPDDFGGVLEVTLEVSRGRLNLGSTAGITFIQGTGTNDAKMVIRGTESAINAAINGLRYQSNLDFNGPDTLLIRVNDLGNTGAGGAQIIDQTIGITVNPVNDAPRRLSATTTLLPVAEDTMSSAGNTVSNLFLSTFDDSKDNQTAVGGTAAHDLAGIAITTNAATAAQGVWQWSTNGNTWNTINGVSTTTALVLSSDTLVRFLPAANFNGAPGSLTVRLIDSSAGLVTSGTIVNVSTSGASTQYSNGTNAVTLNTSITAVNDAPIATGSATLAAVNEDTANPIGATVSTLFSGNFSDAADQVTGGSSANALAGIAIIGNGATTQGTWQYFNGSTWVNVGSRDASSALLVASTHGLRFIPAADFNGTVPALTVHLIDNSSGSMTTGTVVNLSNAGSTGGTTIYSSGTVPLTTTINPVNDAPLFSNLGGTVGFIENGVPVVLDTDATVSDIELSAANNWSGATLRLQRQSGANGQDIFGNSGTLGLLTPGSTIVVDGVTIGSVTTNSNGVLLLTFNGNATTILVNSALQQITYANSSDQPPASVAIAYTINDGNTGAQGSGGALTATGLVTVNITPVNDAPVVTAGATLAYTEDQAPKVIDNTITLSDLDDTQLTGATVQISTGLTPGDVLAAITTGTNITASYNSSTGLLTLTGTDTLANYQQVLRSVTYSSTSQTPTELAATRTVTWQVTDANSDRVGAQSSALVTSTINVNALPNPVDDVFVTNEDTAVTGSVADADPGDGSATYVVTVAPAHGSLLFNPDGSFTYTPNPDFNGTDSFTYRVTDANGDSGMAIATITVNPIADAVNDSAITNEDQLITINVLTNDTFAPGAMVTGITQGNHGTVTINANGTVNYVPDVDFHGTDTFTYTVTSGGVTETATVAVTVNPVVDIVDDTATTDEDQPVTIDVLANDTFDPGAQVTTVTNGSHGTVVINANGTVDYIPDTDFHGVDTFTYTVTTAAGNTETATVTVSVNSVIDIADDTAITNEDQAVIIDVLANDTFGSGAAITQVTNGAKGIATLNANGTITYIPNADFNGLDNFTYTVTTAAGNTETATVTVTVNPVADIANDSATANEDAPIIIDVLANDTFDLGATITEVSQGANGVVIINANGTVTYTPNPDFNGVDSFTYTVTSGGVTETATVDVTVNPIADITHDSATTDEDVPVIIDVLANDTFDPGATITEVSQGANGVVIINANGTVTYTPNPDFNGVDSFTYTVTSGGVTETATVDVTVNPIADITHDSATTDEDVPIIIDVLANDTFASGATITEVTQGANGAVTINSNGTVTYTPNPDFNGADSFTYTVTSGGVVETATVNVTINPVTDIADTNAITDEDQAVIIDVLANDSFEPGAIINSVTQGQNGTVTINQDGTVTYIPNADFNGIDHFTYTVTSGGVAETATVKVTINPVVDIMDDSAFTDEDVPIIMDVLANDSFAVGALVTAVTQGANGVVTINPDGTVTYAPNADFNGVDSFTYTVTSGGVTETATVNVTVNPVMDITDDSAVTDEDTPIVINVLVNDSFGSGAAVTGVTPGTHGIVTINPDGTITYTPNPDFNGTDRFTYTVTSGGVTETAFVDVVINPVNDAPNLDLDRDNSSSIIGTGYRTTFTEEPRLVAIADRDAVIKDLDSAIISSATITLANRPNGTAESLTILGSLPPGITASRYNSSTGQLVLTGSTSLTDYQTAIAQIAYTNAAISIDRRDRTIQVVINDGTTNSNIARTIIQYGDEPRTPRPNTSGSQGSDRIIGTDGDDILNGFSDIDYIDGRGGNDIINGGSSGDTLLGSEGNDIINGGSGNDLLDGGTGNDIINGGSSNDRIFGRDSNDILDGGRGNDRMWGGNGDDIINGGNSNDVLLGESGKDIINGGRGNDVIVGGFGKDVLTGGQGRDQFVYQSVRDFGDTITDFEIVKDRIDFTQIKGIRSMSDLQFIQKGDNAIIQAEAGQSFKQVAVLQDVQSDTLTARHFIF